MLIEDNGTEGKNTFKCSVEAKDNSGIGLENMRERVATFGGNIRFTKEKGFKIFITIPKG